MKKTMKLALFAPLSLSFLVLAACSKDEPKKGDDGKVIQPTSPNEQKMDGGFASARLYKGSWRPTATCTSRSNPELKVTFDFWEKTLTASGTKSETPFTMTSPEIVGQTLGTDRTWNLVGVPSSLAGSPAVRLQLNRFGQGHLLARRSNSSSEYVPKFDCTENTVPYEQKFVQAACAGDANFVASFMDRYPNVADYINQIGVTGETALTCALKNGQESVVEVLLNRPNSGLDFNAGNISQDLPLMLDMNGTGRYMNEWMRRSDVDPNRLDGQQRSLFHTKQANFATLALLLDTKRLDPKILLVPSLGRTTGLGALIDKAFGSSDALSILYRVKSLVEVKMDSPAINGETLLETAITRQSAPLAKAFLAEQPQQRLRASLSASQMVGLAASGCDLDFIRLLDLRKDVDYTAAPNAIDVVRAQRCANSDALVEAFTRRGVLDRQDPATPACQNDASGFSRALTNGGSVYGKTTRIMNCIWNQPNMLQVLGQSSNLSWDWSVLESFLSKAIDSRDANLINVYLTKIRWSGSGAINVLKSALNSQTLSNGQYFDFLANQNALTDANLRVGALSNLFFSLIADDDRTRVAQYLQKVGTSAWPTLDVASQPEATAFYAQEYKDLLENNGCTSPRLAESPLMFALRLGRGDIAKSIGQQMRRASAGFGPQRVSCSNSMALSLMNPVILAAKTCNADVITAASDSGTRFEGAGTNKKTRRNAWDALAISSCSPEQVQQVSTALMNLSGAPEDGELVADGPRSTLVAGNLSDRGYVLKPVLTSFFSLPTPYVSWWLDRSGADLGTFARKDGRVIAGTQAILMKTGTGSSWADYRVSSRYLISFNGLSDYVAFSSSLSFGKKAGCLVLNDSGAELVMKDARLAVEKITVCAATLRFKFNPATSERNLPIRNHIDGEFKFSLDGLSEQTGEN